MNKNMFNESLKTYLKIIPTRLKRFSFPRSSVISQLILSDFKSDKLVSKWFSFLDRFPTDYQTLAKLKERINRILRKITFFGHNYVFCQIVYIIPVGPKNGVTVNISIIKLKFVFFVKISILGQNLNFRLKFRFGQNILTFD